MENSNNSKYIEDLIKKYPKWGAEYIKRNTQQSSIKSPSNIPVKKPLVAANPKPGS